MSDPRSKPFPCSTAAHLRADGAKGGKRKSHHQSIPYHFFGSSHFDSSHLSRAGPDGPMQDKSLSSWPWECVLRPRTVWRCSTAEPLFVGDTAWFKGRAAANHSGYHRRMVARGPPCKHYPASYHRMVQGAHLDLAITIWSEAWSTRIPKV